MLIRRDSVKVLHVISSTPFVVVDLETSGLTPGLDHIIEVAAVKVVNGEVIDEWNTMVNPGIYLPLESTQIHGITTDMLDQALPFQMISQDYLDFLGENAIFVAHNVDFDRDFLNIHLSRAGHEVMSNPYLCTQKLAKRVHPNLTKYGLGSLSEVFGVELPQAHRALHDARATAELLIKFLRVLQNGGLKEAKDIPGLQNYKLPSKEMRVGQVSLF